MADAVLADILIPLTVNLGLDVEWVDEFAWTPTAQQVRTTIDGAPVVEAVVGPTGQRVEVKCGWGSRQAVDELIQIRDRATQPEMTLVLADGRAYTVVLAHQTGNPVTVTPHLIVPEYTPAEQRYEDWYAISLSLIITGSTSANVVASPVISPASGEILITTDIIMTCSTPSALIYYTTDGSNPTELDTLYAGSFNIGASATVKAKAFRTSYIASSIAQNVFTI